MSRGWLGKAALAGAFVFVFVLGWSMLGPSRLGGGASYAVIEGSSMSPALRAGDLAVLRETTDYGVGDVVGYRSAELGRVIVHRIVARNGEQLELKGDGNSWTDGVHPSTGDLIGELWVRVPGLGGIIAWLRGPLGLLVLGSIIIAAIALAWTRSSRAPSVAARPEKVGSPAPVARACAAAAACFLLLGLVGFTRPSTGPASYALPFGHEGRFTYTAPAEPGIYQRAGATTGDPIYLRVAPVVHAAFTYHLDGAEARSVAGTTQMTAEITDDSGWKRTIRLQAEKPFDGPTASASGSVDLRAVWDQIHRVEERTGVPRGAYALTLVPLVKVHGTINGKAFGDEFSPPLSFRLEPLQLVMTVPAGNPASVVLAPAQPGSVRTTRVATRTLKLFGAEVGVPAARIASIAGLLLALIATARSLRTERPRRRSLGPAEIRERYGPMILPVRSAGVTAFKRVIEISNIDVLAQLAERGSGIIFHEHREGKHSYLTPEGDVAYRCVIDGDGDDEPFGPGESAPAEPPRVASPSVGF